MGTWIKETDQAIYLMEEGFYLEKISKTDRSTGANGEKELTVLAMRNWFTRPDPPGKMVVSVGINTQEPDRKLSSGGHDGMRSHNNEDEPDKPPVTFISAHPNNFRARRPGFDVNTIVIHNTVGSTESAVAHFQNSSAQVSAHYIIDRSGEIFQMVDDEKCAFHAGNRDVNDHSIGIEHEATESLKGLTPAQEEASIKLIKFLMKAFDIPAKSVTAHRCVVDTECPSLLFPLIGSEVGNVKGQKLESWINKHF